jgi:hypothetical protein
MALTTGISKKDTDLAIFHPAGGAAVLAFDTGEMLALLQKAGFIDDQHIVVVGRMQRLPGLIPHFIAQPTATPGPAPKHVEKHTGVFGPLLRPVANCYGVRRGSITGSCTQIPDSAWSHGGYDGQFDRATAPIRAPNCQHAPIGIPGPSIPI